MPTLLKVVIAMIYFLLGCAHAAASINSTKLPKPMGPQLLMQGDNTMSALFLLRHQMKIVAATVCIVCVAVLVLLAPVCKTLLICHSGWVAAASACVKRATLSAINTVLLAMIVAMITVYLP
jgi:hypothetical protein